MAWHMMLVGASCVAALVAIACYNYPTTLGPALQPPIRNMDWAEGHKSYADAADVYYMGPGTLRISREKLHGGIRQRFINRMLKALPDAADQGVVLLQGGGARMLYSTDGEDLFKQDSYFFYLFGVNEEDLFGALDIRRGITALFMPRLPAEYAIWMGPLEGPEHYRAKYAVDEVMYVDEMAKWLERVGTPLIHVMSGVNTDSGQEIIPPQFEGSNYFMMEKDTLFNVLTECRVFKTPEELEIIRYANKVASEGHVRLMRECQAGRTMEYQLEASFLHTCYHTGGARSAPFGPIAASGPNAAILHYGHAASPNDRQVQPGDLCLMDMGCMYYGYVSDISSTWPADGKFTSQQRMVYNIVRRAFNATIAGIKPGVKWTALHELALRIILEDLTAAGVLQGSVDQMMEHDVGALFMPCGFGHLMGLDFHDVGGYPKDGPPRLQRPGFKNLRTARHLEVGMVVTVEPGCYFNPSLLLPAMQDPIQSQFMVKDKLMPLIGSGGVRMEDNLVVTGSGSESFTNVPRSIEDVERVMAGGAWEV